MASDAVQFRKIEDVITAYEAGKVIPFAIFSRDQLNIACESYDEDECTERLKEWLNILFANKSAGRYTVRVYKKIPADGITNKTPYNGSFNFQLFDQITGGYNNSHSQEESVNALRSEVAALKVMMEKFMEGVEVGEEPEQGSDMMGKIGALLQNPTLQPILMPLAAKIGEIISKIDFPKKPEAVLKSITDERTA